MIQERLNKVLKIMEEKKIPQMIVSDPAAIFYLTGKWILLWRENACTIY